LDFLALVGALFGFFFVSGCNIVGHSDFSGLTQVFLCLFTVFLLYKKKSFLAMGYSFGPIRCKMKL
jgi:hypothetical protein